MRTFKAVCLSTVTFLAVMGHSHCLAQPPQDDFTDLGAEHGSARLFPSLQPVTFLKISYFAFRQSTPHDPNQNTEKLVFPVTSTAQGNTSWVLIRKGDSDPAEGTDIVDQVQRIDLQSIPGNAYFYFKPGALRTGDQLQVGVITKDEVSKVVRRKLHSSDLAKATALVIEEEPSFYTLTLDPRTVADQELLDGTSKTVHQLGLDLNIPSLGSFILGNPYFSTENVFSTEQEDKSAQIDLRLGIERSILSSWYLPANLETRYVTNQAFNNRSFVVSGGLRTYIPWGFFHHFERRLKKGLTDLQGNLLTSARTANDLEIVHTGLLWNHLVKSPLAPELSLNLQYEDRIELDPATSAAHAAESVGRVEALFELNPVYLLSGSKPTPNDIVLAVKAKGWWFLNEESLPAASVRKRESNLEADISIPLSRFKDGLLSSVQSEDATVKMFQIRYRTGANEANSFIRSTEWSLGFNILK